MRNRLFFVASVVILTIIAHPNIQVKTTAVQPALVTQVVATNATAPASTVSLSFGIPEASGFTITGDPSGWNYQGTLDEVLCDYFGGVFCKTKTEY